MRSDRIFLIWPRLRTLEARSWTGGHRDRDPAIQLGRGREHGRLLDVVGASREGFLRGELERAPKLHRARERLAREKAFERFFRPGASRPPIEGSGVLGRPRMGMGVVPFQLFGPEECSPDPTLTLPKNRITSGLNA